MPLIGSVSGSHTKLSDGTSSFIAGSGVAVATGSNGAVTITNSAGSVAGSNTQVQYNSSGDFGADADLTFDGDTLTATNSSNTAIPAITIDRNYTGTTSVGNMTTDASGLLVDYDVTGIVASGQLAFHDAISINYNQDSPTMVGTVLGTGLDVKMTGGTSGAQTMVGTKIVLAGADDSIGLDITVPNGEAHLVARSPDAITDFFKISVAAAGETTLSTNDADGSVGHLTLDADGKIILNALAGKEVVLNEDGLNVDFRVETQNEDEAILVDASADALHINKGKSAFSTKIWSNSDNAFEVNSSGVVINEEGHATNDFRVESDTKSHALFVDAGTNQVLILSGGGVSSTNEATGADVAFYVSGTLASKDSSTKGTALFGGDLVVSGNLHGGFDSEAAGNYLNVITDVFWLSNQDGWDNDLVEEGVDTNFIVSGSIGSRGTDTKGTSVFGGDVVVSGTLYANTAVAVDHLTITADEIDVSSGNLTLDVAGDIVLDAAGENIFFDVAGVRVMGVTSISSNAYLAPTATDKDLILADDDDNAILTVDSSDSALKINRKLGLDVNTLVDSSAALSANAPFNKIVNTTGSDITGALPNPTFEGQIQIVLGLQSSSGNCIVTYLNAANGTTSKTLTSGVAITLISFDASGAGAYRWCVVGDVS